MYHLPHGAPRLYHSRNTYLGSIVTTSSRSTRATSLALRTGLHSIPHPRERWRHNRGGAKFGTLWRAVYDG